MTAPATPTLDAPAGAASRHATSAVPVAGPDDTAGDIRERLVAAPRFDSAVDVAVLDGDRLVGLIRIEDLLAADATMTARTLMDADPPAVAPGSDQEAAAWKAVHHGQSSLAVVSPDGRYEGLIPPYRMLAVLLEEHDEDLARVAGYLHSSEVARQALEESLTRRFWHRLPWLIVGLAGALLSAVVLAAFETRLESDLALAFFVPGIVYLAGAVAIQTETVVVRGLSVGVGVGGVVRRELLTGLALGAVLALLFLPIGAAWFSLDVGLAVSMSLLAASATATVVATVLPAAISRFGADPAFGSGPLSTVVEDVLSLVVYFGIASLLVA